MKINHRRKNPRPYNLGSNWDLSLLKHESNRERRRTDREALVNALNGDDGTVFAKSNMGNPFHWD